VRHHTIALLRLLQLSVCALCPIRYRAAADVQPVQPCSYITVSSVSRARKLSLSIASHVAQQRCFEGLSSHAL
jgi:hypothetical protein